MMRHYYQQGFSFTKAFGVLIILTPLVLIGWQMANIYLEYRQIRQAILSVGEDVTSYNIEPREIQRRLERTLSLDYITAISPSDLAVNRRGGTITIELVYEDKRAFFGQFKIVGDFNESIQIYP